MLNSSAPQLEGRDVSRPSQRRAARRPPLIRHPDEVQAARAALHDDEVYIALAETFRTLGDSTRAKIVCLLMRREMCVTDLAAVVEVTESAVSQHLRILRGQAIVRHRRDGQHVFYTLVDEHIEQIVGIGLEHLGHSLELDPAEPAVADTAPVNRRAGRPVPHLPTGEPAVDA